MDAEDDQSDESEHTTKTRTEMCVSTFSITGLD